jgi:hypothetical protein
MRTRTSLALTCLVLLVACGGEKASQPAEPPSPPPPVEPAPAGDEGSEAETPSATNYQVVEVTDGGTVTGKVVWTGERPTVEPFSINKNPEICDLDRSGKRASSRLILAKDGGVKNAVVFLEGVRAGKAHAPGPWLLDQRGCDYHPHVMIVPTKSEVAVRSSDDILHNVHMFGAANYNIPFPKPQELGKKLRKQGLVRLQCDAGHGWMTAYFHSVDHPYYAITGDDGAFELRDVPPGTYQISMWHEHWDITDKTEKDGQVATYTFAEPITQTKDVVVAASGNATVSFTLP